MIGELEAYSEKLLELPRYLALNKIDIFPRTDSGISFEIEGDETVFEISAVSGEGLPDLMRVLYNRVIEEISGEEKEEKQIFDPASDPGKTK